MSPTAEDQSVVSYPHTADFTGRAPPPPTGYSWDQIKAAIVSSSLHVLRRTDKGQFEYEQWQAKIDRIKYTNAGEYIAFTILKWPDLVDPAGLNPQVSDSKMTLVQRHKAIDPRLTLRLNHYPFPVEESIQYFVLWSTRDMSTLEERERLDKYLHKQLTWPEDDILKRECSPELLPPAPGKHKEWMWFVNPIELRSIATVHHIHVFVRDV
ncbi:hypothetical protein BGZ83_008235 [Gryganskiella cystojenkinii]|nr:hypothetical protein BGZ83_008235 [Gryganskiella cystojenkinii]